MDDVDHDFLSELQREADLDAEQEYEELARECGFASVTDFEAARELQASDEYDYYSAIFG